MFQPNWEGEEMEKSSKEVRLLVSIFSKNSTRNSVIRFSCRFHFFKILFSYAAAVLAAWQQMSTLRQWQRHRRLAGLLLGLSLMCLYIYQKHIWWGGGGGWMTVGGGEREKALELPI